jgi:hypothetical protein
VAEASPTPDRPPRRLFFLRRILPLLLILAGGLWYFRDAPRDVVLSMDLAGRRDGLRAVRMDARLLPGHDQVRHVELFYSPSSPPPPLLRVPLRVPPGDYELELFFDYGVRTDRVERQFVLDRQDEVALAP